MSLIDYRMVAMNMFGTARLMGVIAGLALSLPAAAQAPQRGGAGSAPKPTPAACAPLHEEYEDASKRLAQIHAQGLGDQSAPRATMREAESTKVLAGAGMTLELLKAHGCPLPTAAPSGTRYANAARICNLAMLEARRAGIYTFPASCERRQWVQDQDSQELFGSATPGGQSTDTESLFDKLRRTGDLLPAPR